MPNTAIDTTTTSDGGSEVAVRAHHKIHSMAVSGGFLDSAALDFADGLNCLIGGRGTGKTHVALGLALAVCQKGLFVGFTTAATLVQELIEARDEKRLRRLQSQLAKYRLLIINELGFVSFSKTGAKLLFEIFSKRFERGSTLVTSSLLFDEWTEVFGSERRTGALLDRLIHHAHILECNGEGYRLTQARVSKRVKAHRPRPNT